MICFYRVLFLPAFIVAFPYYGYRMLRRGGYSKDFKHRLGLFHHLPEKRPGIKRIWLQAVSVGEVNAVGPLIELLTADGEAEVVLTTTTSTGYREALTKYTNSCVAIGVFPIDFWPFSLRAWNRIRPDAIILTESELWPEHLHQAKARTVPAFLINARMSDRSFQRYQKVRFLAKRILGKLTHVFASSEDDAQRLKQLGVETDRLTMAGNIKFDVDLGKPLSTEQRVDLRASLGFRAPEAVVLIGSSTWPGEEAMLLEVQRKAIAAGIDCRLLLVPRHAERAPEIVKLLKAQDLNWHQRSSGKDVDRELRIHLADTTGELRTLTQTADVAFIGKSLPPNQGGQTPIEAAGLGVPTVMGPNMQNFKHVVRSLLSADAAVQTCNTVGTHDALIELLDSDDTRPHTLATNGRRWHTANRGSSGRITEAIRSALTS